MMPLTDDVGPKVTQDQRRDVRGDVHLRLPVADAEVVQSVHNATRVRSFAVEAGMRGGVTSVDPLDVPLGRQRRRPGTQLVHLEDDHLARRQPARFILLLREHQVQIAESRESYEPAHVGPPLSAR
jgi:hypothetical protein